MGYVSHRCLVGTPSLHRDQVDVVQCVDQVLQARRIAGSYFKKDDPSLRSKLSETQKHIEDLQTIKQKIIDVSALNYCKETHPLINALQSRLHRTLGEDDFRWINGKCWCARLLNELPIFVMPCCFRRIHLNCFKRWVEQIRTDARESYIVCGIMNHFHTARRTCECGSGIARFAEPEVWME